ncbi:MAG: methyltransferase domain-containing protein [Bacillota bacterium]|nr:methyltransferase domain-containing protein [Bacillota bacterium]
MERNFKKSFWQLYARVYDNVMLCFLPYHQLLYTVTEKLNPQAGWHVLDAGCGTGNFLHHLLHYRPGVTAVGIDYADAMLHRAAVKINNNKDVGKDVVLQETNLNYSIPFKEEEFQGVICVNVLYAVDNPVFLLKELSRVLQRGGRLVLVTPPFQPRIGPVFREHVLLLKERKPFLWPFSLAGRILCLAPWLFIFLILNIFIKKQQSFHFFKREELLSLVKNCGFELVSLEKVYGGQDWFLEAVKPAAKVETVESVYSPEGGVACLR